MRPLYKGYFTEWFTRPIMDYERRAYLPHLNPFNMRGYGLVGYFKYWQLEIRRMSAMELEDLERQNAENDLPEQCKKCKQMMLDAKKAGYKDAMDIFNHWITKVCFANPESEKCGYLDWQAWQPDEQPDETTYSDDAADGEHDPEVGIISRW